MPHFLVDDSMPFHAKIVAAGNAAIGLWTRAGAWSNQQANLTEGFIPEHMARTMGTPAQIKRLVATKLWHQVTGGYQFHEWLGPGRQRSRETILDHQRKRAEAGRIGGQRSGQTRRRTGQHGRSESEADAEAFASPDAAPPLPPQPVDNANAPQFRGPPDTTEKSANFGREPSPPAQMRSNSEAHAQAKPKQNGTHNQYPFTRDLGGNVALDIAREKFREGPPRYHPGHDTGYVAGCTRCDRSAEAHERWLVELRAAEPDDPEPPRHCDDHHPGGSDWPCRRCKARRELHEEWLERHQARQRADTGRYAAIHACARRRLDAGLPPLCDEDGWRVPPAELTHRDYPVVKCDHRTTDLPPAWRDLITADDPERTPAP